MSKYKELQTQQKALAARLKGAILYQHKYRGMVYQLVDGTFLSQAEYKVLRRQCMFYMLFAI